MTNPFLSQSGPAPLTLPPSQAHDLLCSLRWPTGIVCPHCQLAADHWLLRKPAPAAHHSLALWKCSGCRKQFTVTVKTVLENTKLPLEKWIAAVHLCCLSPDGANPRRLQIALGVSYRTARMISSRLRSARGGDPLWSEWLKATRRSKAFVVTRQDRWTLINTRNAQHAEKQFLADFRRHPIPNLTLPSCPKLSLWPLDLASSLAALLKIQPAALATRHAWK